jgi:hypothetical protein
MSRRFARVQTSKPDDNRNYCNPLLSVGFRFFPPLRNANSSREGIRKPSYRPVQPFGRAAFLRHGGTQLSCGAGCDRGFGLSWVPNLIGFFTLRVRQLLC